MNTGLICVLKIWGKSETSLQEKIVEMYCHMSESDVWHFFMKNMSKEEQCEVAQW